MNKKITLLWLSFICFGQISANIQVENLYPEIWSGNINTNLQGLGTEANPYIITTAEQLAGIEKQVNNGTTFSHKYFRLEADIWLNDTANWHDWSEETPPTNQWKPIGQSTPFKGVFDGNNHCIIGLYINEETGNAGLFGKIGSGCIIKNLKIEYANVQGNEKTGSLIGFVHGNDERQNWWDETPLDDTYIQNCTINKAIVKGKGEIGGIIGCGNLAKAKRCAFNGLLYNFDNNISNTSTGGIIGRGWDTQISQSKSQVIIESATPAGGIIATTRLCTIEQCVSISIISGKRYVGGLVAALDESSIKNSYTKCSIKSDDKAGGVVGLGSMASIENCYVIGKAVQGRNCGGIIYMDESAYDPEMGIYIVNSYYDESIVKNTTDNQYARTAAQLKQRNMFVNWDFYSIWDINPNINNGYPYLLWIYQQNF